MDARLHLLPNGPAGPAPRRADATRNHALLLDTARRILDESGVEGLTMDKLAREAGLGKGTIFRRFGSRTGLLREMLNEIESDFQRRFMSGPPPLGPGAGAAIGADAVTRLIAYGRERIELLSIQGDLLRASEEIGDERYSSPARAVGLLHLRILLKQAGFDGDIEVASFTLLAALEATLILYENRAEHISMQRLADGWELLVLKITACTS
ncbi:helix-turn-helix domain-containing protein [Subtercola sp. RTI3]|uniref:TetR/AcrR family transcriptional regulator n=1 Tax=Subtercola sp. RTI3 TaxID=3048639 RepID=UPI002B234454|nr:helix-turn-helix domain-containing protein [Subtercola sp. RTI3]MEA9984005.1 helix-turn-helix domain-containing protein [Subtercola sp. RTI3]